MCTKLETYETLHEVEENFQVEYINNCHDFCRLIHQVQQDTGMVYRGVKSARYKMYSSAQRFYIEKNLTGEMAYADFLKDLYEVSKEVGNGYIMNLYETVKHDNYYRYDVANICNKGEIKEIGYNPIWAFYTLQHVTECSPLLDFTVNFAIALYFASQELLSRCDSISNNEIDNYIEIIAIKENEEIGYDGNRKYVDFMEERIMNAEDINNKNKLPDIYEFDIANYQDKIQYICYGVDAFPLISSGFEYHFSFANANVEVQEARLMITSQYPKIPFEDFWNDIFTNTNDSPKIQVYLIHKSLVNEICRYLSCMLLGKNIVPIKKNYKQEIIELIRAKKRKEGDVLV